MTIGSQYDFNKSRSVTQEEYGKLLEVAAENDRIKRELAEQEEAKARQIAAERRREIEFRRDLKSAIDDELGW